ncbi:MULTISPECIES: Rz-like lysis system protein LysB [unclassified Pseudomonas]|uniref:Rz-like lysis system protein LysB n=1 Tax=unclassified Pseudomonas TaxID=196821 RepID=UPI001473E68D|nr:MULTISPECIES: Rz-like lysis system protein LysB [unclassified Pseudomonas]NMY38155.1 LysB family phage lysis regulatory protein [Pseudomonas sp. WS 5078]NMY61071.1 LysB family phage lysis regulatory protein [Pseudomonas sp. WS 5354]
MSALRQALYGLALLGALALFIWGQQQRISVARQATELAQHDAKTAREDAARNLNTATTLNRTLNLERQAQSQLRSLHDQLRQGLAQRELQIEGLKRENTALRDWAAQPLPDIARRLRERPALTGADAYRQWLSGRGAMPTASDRPKP